MYVVYEALSLPLSAFLLVRKTKTVNMLKAKLWTKGQFEIENERTKLTDLFSIRSTIPVVLIIHIFVMYGKCILRTLSNFLLFKILWVFYCHCDLTVTSILYHKHLSSLSLVIYES